METSYEPGNFDPTDSTKLRELILYICLISEDDEHFSVTKLNKLLFYSDFGTYLKINQPITGQAYRKKQYGPVPVGIEAVTEDMKEQELLAFSERRVYTYTQKRPVALRDPDLTLFSGSEIGMVQQVVRRFRHMTATQISDTSHQFEGWQMARDGAIIPYASALLNKHPVTPEVEQWVAELDMTGVEEMFQEYGADHKEASPV